jgi:hypothetical protein
MTDARGLREEVHQLLNAVQAVIQDAALRFPESQDGTHGGGECLPWCPICQFANVLRGEHPEVTERLSEAANAIASAMKALADVALARAAQPESSRRPKPAPRVEHIRIDDSTES